MFVFVFIFACAVFIFGIVVAVRRGIVAKRNMVFAAFALFGTLSGFVAALYGHHEGQTFFNLPSVLLGDHVYSYSIRHFGDNHSAFAHYTIPWVLRTPQVVLFTSAIIWSLLGVVAQLVYNQVKKPAATKGIPTLIVVGLLLACLGVSVGTVYATQNENEKQGPILPSAFPVSSVMEIDPQEMTEEWKIITTWELEGMSVTRWGQEDLSPSDEPFRIGEHIFATAIVKNTGSKRGRAEIDILVDGVVLNSQEIPLLPGESKPAKFVVLVPRPGVYTVMIGNLTDSFEVVEQN